MKIISVVGARPNFMKIAPFSHAVDQYNDNKNSKKINHIIVHTGQHYDDRMSKTFFNALNIPEADINLGIGSGSHAEQVGYTMIAFEKVLIKEKPDWVIVFGDVNATLACTVTSKKLNIKVCHIEAGLRSGDIEMPEEINRLVTDRLSDLLLTPDKLSVQNLLDEGTNESRIKFVGNIMIDTLEENRVKAEAMKIEEIIKNNQLILSPSFHNSFKQGSPFVIFTLHRPSNVDKREILEPIVEFLLKEVTKDIQIIWPIHPRTQKILKEFELWNKITLEEKIILLHPIGYHEMLRLNMEAKIMFTDSGGLQEECTILGTPCLTLRFNTERPVTLRLYGGTCILVGNNIKSIRKEYKSALKLDRQPRSLELWDGQTAQRCLNEIINFDC